MFVGKCNLVATQLRDINGIATTQSPTPPINILFNSQVTLLRSHCFNWALAPCYFAWGVYSTRLGYGLFACRFILMSLWGKARLLILARHWDFSSCSFNFLIHHLRDLVFASTTFPQKNTKQKPLVTDTIDFSIVCPTKGWHFPSVTSL